MIRLYILSEVMMTVKHFDWLYLRSRAVTYPDTEYSCT